MTLSLSDIVTDPDEYAARRPANRGRMIPLRAERRVRLGDMIVVEFENEETLRYQVQEMVYTERLSAPADVAHEIEVYSRLLPTSHSLTATIFIELNVPHEIRAELDRLAGVQNALGLEIGGTRVASLEIPGVDEDPADAAVTVSVHMIRFPLDDETRDAFRDPAVPVELVVDHPAYSDGTPIAGATRQSLIADLAFPRA
jgi:Protein of unknown function (DUF3501)